MRAKGTAYGGRRPGTSRRRALMLVAAGALVLSGCGGGETKQAGAEGKRLPGIKEFGLAEEEFSQHVEKSQQRVASCMADAGFEYVPVDVATVEAAQARVRTDPGSTRRTYKERWGLGVTTRFDNPVRDTGLGPNLAIWRGLPPADAEAYARTLWGEDPDNPLAEFVFAFDEEDFSETGGCTREGVAATFTRSQLKGTYVNPKDVLVESDPRIVQANRDWATCMKAAGYDYNDDQDEIIEEYQDRLDDLLDGDDPRTLTGPRAEALRDLQRQEVEVSLVDLRCQVKYTDKVYREVEIEVFGQPVSG